jgi:methionyl aminopeptidase
MEPLDALREAGRIASKVRRWIGDEVEVGMRLMDICDGVEGRIRDLGGEPAFPCNVDIDHVAAHYTSPVDDKSHVQENSLVKVDIGVHVDGYLADTATTICLEPQLKMLVVAAEAALDAGLRIMRAGTKASEVGSVIERTMKMMGVVPIRNLTGHKMARFIIHAGKAIPNVSSLMVGHRLGVGDVYAVEPFTTLPNAAGEVADGPGGNIYRFQKRRSVDGEQAKEMLKFIQSEYRTLPFASRWVLRRFPGLEGREAFSELFRRRCIYSYPQLIERSRGPVAQAEHTVIIEKNGCEITTA